MEQGRSVWLLQSVYRVKGGTGMNPNRLEETVRKHENTLYRTALAVLGDAHEAQDAVQDTFVRYLEKAPEFDSPEHEKAWLIRVTVNGCRSRLRSPWRKRRTELSEGLPAPEPEEKAVLEAVLALPPRDRVAVHLYYYEGYSTPEIATMTGQSEGTVRSRLSRARQKLKVLLADAE